MAPTESSLERELDRLNARKESLFRRVQLCYDASRELLHNQNDTKKLENFKIRYSQFTKTIVDYKDVIHQIVTVKQKINPTEAPSYQMLESVEDLSDHVEYVANEFIHNKKNHLEQPTVEKSINHERIQMPKIELMKFNGEDLTLWPLFYENFKHFVHIKSEFSNAEKLQYLLSSLSGRALKTCSAVEPIPDNYHAMWKLLEDTYQDNKYLANLYLERLFSFHLNTNQNYLQIFLENFDTTVVALKRLKIIDLLDYIITYLALSKLPDEFITSFELVRDSQDLPTYEELVKFVKRQSKIIKTENKSRSTHSCPITKYQKNNKSFLVQNTKQTTPVVRINKCLTVNTANNENKSNFKSNNCIVCNCSFHPVSRCTEFLKLSPAARYKMSKERNLCLNCLNPNHRIINCKSTILCNRCNKKHHSLLHFDRAIPTQLETQTKSTNLNSDVEINSAGTSGTANIAHSLCSINRTPTQNTTVLLSTAIVYALDSYNQPQKIRFLLDTGSQRNFITFNCAKRLGLNVTKINYFVQGIDSATKLVKGCSHITFISRFNNQNKYSMDVLVVDKITDCLPSVPIDTSNLQHLINLPLADYNYHVPGEVDGLVGATLLAQLLGPGKVTGLPNTPVAVQTELGYILMGEIPTISSEIESTQTFCVFENLENIMTKFWEVEQVPTPTMLDSDDLACEKIFTSTVSRDPSGRYTVHLPFQLDTANLGKSYDIARRRFLSLERKLENNPTLRLAYDEVMRDFIDQNHMSLVTNPKLDESNYFIPHHAIFKESSSTPVRIVYDASAKTDNSVSLNDLLYAGPKLQKDLFNLLLDFRLFAVALTADIKQMFRQILITPEHRKFQRLLWRFSANDPLSVYEINTVCFGVKSSPYLALRTVQQLAQDEKERFPLASQIIQDHFYVDDFVFSVEDDHTAENLYLEVIELFKAGRFEIVKWASNSQSLMRKIPDDLKLQKNLDFDESFKVLGLVWQPLSDQFCFRLNRFDPTPTKRNVLSTLAQIFDPLGLISSVTMYIKLLIRDYWNANLDWDQTPPKSLEARWFAFREQLECLENCFIPRHLSVNSHSAVTLIGFADSSEKGYAAVIYLRAKNNHRVFCRLVCAKSKVAPLKVLSIPRLELCAALLLSKLISLVVKIFNTRIHNIALYALSDSTVTLHWVNSSPHRWNTFVANRVAKIQQNVPNNSWYHISTNVNMADNVSRGLTPSQFILNKNEWFLGPEWILDEPNHWPVQRVDFMNTFSLEERSSSLAVVDIIKSPLFEAISRFSTYNRLVNMTVYVLKFAKILSRSLSISVSDITKAEEILVKTVQMVHFSSEIKCLSSGKPLNSSIRTLRPFLDKVGVLRVGGRLSHAQVDYDQQHPMLLSNKDHFVELLVKYYHEKHLHVGAFSLSSILRQRFWIIGSRKLIRKIIHACNLCFHHNPKPTFPIMSDLPAPRVNETKAFLHTGTDFAGPFRITISRHRGNRTQKAYLCLFICLTTKAVHLELCSDLSTNIFMAAFKRFLARRGPISVIYSDCGTNFIGAKTELQSLYEFIRNSDYNDSLKQELLKNRITWKLNPPHAPHFGGLWESNIKSCKSILLKTIGDQILTYEELNTILTQIEAILNSRPLYSISSDPSDPVALTPAHFLNTMPLESLPVPDYSHLTPNLIHRKHLLDKLVQSYWKRWRMEYLSTLQNRQKWNLSAPPIQVGTVVVLMEENSPPFQWPLAVVTEIYPGKDQIVRVALVKTKTGLYKRPVVKLCPLPTQ